MILRTMRKKAQYYTGVEWLSQSLDINPMKNLWRELKVCLVKQQSQNITTLEKTCMEESTGATLCSNLPKDYRKQLTSVITNQG